ncbi:MAG: hypothetical protein F6K40_09040 [Okeania sp. SIO3I5]|uniref:hypothetical protein n=1 Tax=Okeania sp. SIO3I5 TaxID=2607805 RepID=UPI0013BE83F2|nr:hypothetical protein [Okeania sp. SIO3I5]NEQ36409.1 hypothetical protein [Okeania sp. SIO3I5]
MVLSPENLRVNNQEKFSELAQKQLLENSNSDKLFQGSFLRHTLTRSKIVSQIISYIWLYAESDPLARQAKHWFQNPTKNFDQLENPTVADKLPSLAKLMGAKPQDQTIYGEFLSKVFSDVKDDSKGLYNFPLFNKQDIESGIVVFKTDATIASGSIQDPNPNSPNVLTVMIAFPPCPQFSAATVTKEELSNWLNNRDSSNYTPPNSYVPCCCS